MTKKVLFVATVDSHIELFHLPYLKMFHDKGWEVHVATDTGKKIEYCDKKIKLPIKRSPFKLVSNYKAIRKLREVMKKEGYSIVHCHTPMGGVVARMAGRKLRRQGQRMIYTAHGFHFYKGAPVHYWLMFYPVEWYLAKYTDTLIVINSEDYERAKRRFGKRCQDIQYIPGVGVDPKNFEKKMSINEKRTLRRSLGLKDVDKVLICVGRLDKNKNQGFLIRAMQKMLAEDSHYHLLLVGPDELNGKYQRLADKLSVSDHVHFLGFRKDIPELLQVSDVAVSVSKREGLGLNLIEALMSGTPVVALDNRGHRDIVYARNGFLIKNEDEYMEGVDLSIKTDWHGGLHSSVVKFGANNSLNVMAKIYNFGNTNQPLRVLHIFNTMTFGGSENAIMNIYRELNKSRVQFDFLLHGESVFADEIKEYGGKIYTLPGYINKLGPIKYGIVLRKFFRTNRQYDIIHCHLDKTSGTIIRNIKKIYNPICISHSHCSGESNGMLVRMYKKHLKRLVNKYSDCKLACSDSAGKWLYDGKFTVLNNPIDINRFKYDQENRKKVRKQLGISEDVFVIGAIGRFEAIKNHAFLIDVFMEYRQYDKNARLIIVGDGSLKQTISDKIIENKVGDCVTIIPPGHDVEKYYSAFDLFVVPSKSEGLGIVLLEAASNGLPIFSTSNIPKNIIEATGAIVIDGYDAKEWAVRMHKMDKSRVEKNNLLLPFEAKRIAKEMSNIYVQLLNARSVNK